MFKGAYVALVTPFKDGRFDEKKVQELVEWHLAEKTNGFVPMGTTGESVTLSHEEHLRFTEVVVKAVRKRVPVIAGAGSNSTEEAIHLTVESKKRGADAVLSVNPYYNRPTQEGLFAHFSEIAKVANMPIILYNIPSRTGVNLNVETVVALAQSQKNIVGVKESTGVMDQTTEIIQRLGNKFIVFSGDDSLTLPLMSIGAVGVISVVANLVPRAVSDLCKFCLDGEWGKARELHLKLFPLVKSMFLETNPAPLKAAMKDAGLIEDETMRLPMVSVTADTRKKIRAAMKAFGVNIPVAR